MINLFNTSWISTRKERPGQMHFPTTYVDKMAFSLIGDINISLIHHPDHWLDPNNKREMETLLQETSDFILSGHEHTPSNITVTDWTRRAVHFIEGSALQEEVASNSGYNVLQFDLDEKSFCVKKYYWNSLCYSVDEEDNWKPLIKELTAKANDPNFLMVIPKFDEFLNEVGIPITHPRVQDLMLEDIYVYPNIEEIIYKGDTQVLSTPEEIPDLLNVDKKSHFLFTGDKDSGKTVLAKMLFKYFQDQTYYPLYIHGNDVIKSMSHNIDLLIKNTCKNVYEDNKQPLYLQLEKDKRILIIDDWHKSLLNTESKTRFLGEANKYFEKVIFFSENNNKVSDSMDMISKDGQYNFRHFEIMSFGHVKRDEFIEKWVSLGQRETMENMQLIREIDRINKKLKPILMQSFVPKYPLYILIILKTIESGTPHNLDKSSNGYYFEVLIKDSLASIEIENNETDKIYQYLTDLAFEMLSKPTNTLTLDEWRTFHKRHLEYYDMNEDQIIFKEIQTKLVKEKVIKNVSIGYEYYYPYVYYFFVAQYIARNINLTKVKSLIHDMCNNLHVSKNANIIMFLTHLSKNEFVKEEVLTAAKGIFKGFSPLKLEGDVNIINELCEELSPLVLEDINVRDHRNKLNEQLDEIERLDKNEMETAYSELAADNDNEDNSLDMGEIIESIDMTNKGIKMLEIIGQILKNYYGSMSGEDKQKLCEELFQLGLRINHSFISDLYIQKEKIIHYISGHIIEKGLENKSERAEKMAKKILYAMISLITLNILAKIGLSVGTPDLDRTFNRVRESLPYNSVELINLVIKLECYEAFPYNDVMKFYKKNQKNKVAQQAIQSMVKKYLYMFETSRFEKQCICDLVGIEFRSKMTLQIKNK